MIRHYLFIIFHYAADAFRYAADDMPCCLFCLRHSLILLAAIFDAFLSYAATSMPRHC